MNASPAHLRIDFVSDVACPWCAIGLASLQQALAALEETVQAEIHLQPFELDPHLPPGGEDANQRLMQKYGIGEAQLEESRRAIRDRGAPLGVTINTGRGSRAWNTFDAHRLLHWAGTQDRDRALALKRALFRAYFTDEENVADREVLVRIATDVGLDAAQARQVLETNAYATDVRALEQRYRQAGIQSVPTTIIDGKWVIPGGQPPETFEGALRDIAVKARTGPAPA